MGLHVLSGCFIHINYLPTQSLKFENKKHAITPHKLPPAGAAPVDSEINRPTKRPMRESLDITRIFHWLSLELSRVGLDLFRKHHTSESSTCLEALPLWPIISFWSTYACFG
jgi:hypothetical protein